MDRGKSRQEQAPETLRMGTARRAVFLADLAFLFDACDASQGGPRLVAACPQDACNYTPLRPRWADRLLGFAER